MAGTGRVRGKQLIWEEPGTQGGSEVSSDAWVFSVASVTCTRCWLGKQQAGEGCPVFSQDAPPFPCRELNRQGTVLKKTGTCSDPVQRLKVLTGLVFFTCMK